jgi:predicted nucleic acid-binding Zn ribbon protein
MKTAKFINSKKSATRLGPLLKSILARMGLGHSLDGWRIVNLWPEIVGDKIADVSKAIRYENETLFISVPDAVWRQELLLDVDRILQEIHTVPGGRSVKKIHFIA